MTLLPVALALWCLLCVLVVPSLSLSLSLTPRDVRIESLRTAAEADIAVDIPQPSFSWHLDTERDPATGHQLPAVTQTGYELLVAAALSGPGSPPPPLSSPLWHFQSASTSQSTHVRYLGPALQPDERYHWRLRYHSSSGASSGWASGLFRTALMLGGSEAAWGNGTGTWIGSSLIDMNQLRREFRAPASVSRASVFVSGVGLYELYLNGRQVDETRRLDPAWTHYQTRTLYASFDVTAMLRQDDDNCLGVMLGHGFFSAEQWGDWSVYDASAEYGPPRVLLLLRMHLANGSVVEVASDRSWTGREGPILHNGIYFGEDRSERREREGWSEPGFVDPLSLWLPAEQLSSPVQDGGFLSLQTQPPIRIGAAALHTDLLSLRQLHWQPVDGQPDADGDDVIGAPITATSISPVHVSINTGVDVFDLQQNIAGVCSVSFQAADFPGPRHITMRHGESINPVYPNGQVYPTIDVGGLRGSAATSTYTFMGNASRPPATYAPRFTYYGFRYLTVQNAHGTLNASSVTCYPQHSETSLVGTFNSSSSVLTQLMHNMVWSQRANVMGIPTACAQRDERTGWTGDNGLSVDQALYSLDLEPLYEAWLQAILDFQPADGSVPDIVPYAGQHSACRSAAFTSIPSAVRSADL